MQVDREEHHQFVLALPYNLHGTTPFVMVYHLVLGAWLGYTLVGHSAYQQLYHNHSVLCILYVACWVGNTYWPGMFCASYNWKFCGPHSKATAPPLWNVQNLMSLLLFWLFVLPHTTNHTTLNLHNVCSNLHLSLGLYNLMPNFFGLVGTSWEWLTPGIV